MKRWVGFVWTVGLVLGLVGCDALFGEEPGPVAPVAPTVTVPRFAEAPFIIPLGEPLTLTAYVTRADGTPETGYTFTWGGWLPDGPEVKAEVGHPSPGVETVTLTFLREVHLDVSAIVTVVNDAGAAVVRVPPARVIAWGGTTRELLPFQPEVSLRVGEARPVAALPLGQRHPAESTVRTLGKEPLTYVIADPAIARVDATGVVHGLAPGTTTLTFQSGSVTARVPVRVQAGALEDSAGGVWVLDGLGRDAVRPEYGARLRAGKLAPDDQLAVDSRGRALAVLSGSARPAPPLLPMTLYTVLLGRWTGSGLGLEWVSQPWDEAEDPRLALDGRDVPYVTYSSRHLGDIVVADRPATGAPDSWRHRRLPLDLKLAAQSGLRIPQYVGRHALSHVAMLAREGGGMWIAYRTVDDFRDQDPSYYGSRLLEPPGTCAEVIHLAEVTDATVEAQEVYVRWHDAVKPAPCGSPTTLTSTRTDMPLQLLPPAPGERWPRLLSTHGPGLQLLESRAGAWTERELGHPALQSTGFVGPAFVALARPETPGGATVLLTYDTITGPLPADLTVNALPGQAALPYVSYGGGSSDRQTLYFGFQSEGRLFSGSGFAGPLVVQTGFGGVLKEEPTGAWVPRAYDRQWGEDFPIRGQAHRGAWLHLLSENSLGVPQLLSRPLPAADPLPTDPESRGTRLGGQALTVRASTPPQVLADGTRYLLTDFAHAGAPGAVLRSAGPGQPFVTQRSRIPGEPLATARQLWTSRGGLFFLTEQGRTLGVHRSTDQGKGFAPVSTLSIDMPLEAALFHPEGPLFVMLRDPAHPLNFQVGFSPDAASATPPVLRAGFSATDEGKLLGVHGRWLPTASGAWLVLDTLVNDGTSSRARVLLREYDSAGQIVSERTVDPRLSPGNYLWPVGASLSGDGALLWVTATESRRFTLATGALEVVPLPVKNLRGQEALAPVRLADGRLLLSTTEASVPHTYRAGYRLSSDGLHWGLFQALRPTGGDAQEALGVAAEPDGGALFVLQDSGLMMAGDGEVTPQVLVQRVVP